MKKNIGFILVIVILLLVSLGLGGYIFYDKYYMDKSDKKEDMNAAENNSDVTDGLKAKNINIITNGYLFDMYFDDNKTDDYVRVYAVSYGICAFEYKDNVYYVTISDNGDRGPSFSDALSYFVDNFSNIKWDENGEYSYKFEDESSVVYYFHKVDSASKISQIFIQHAVGATDPQSESYVLYSNGDIKDLNGKEYFTNNSSVMNELKKYNYISSIKHVCIKYDKDVCVTDGYVIEGDGTTKIIENED